jgi:hypothetical protein
MVGFLDVCQWLSARLQLGYSLANICGILGFLCLPSISQLALGSMKPAGHLLIQIPNNALHVGDFEISTVVSGNFGEF